MYLAYKFKVAWMSSYELSREIVALAENNSHEKLAYVASRPASREPLFWAAMDIVNRDNLEAMINFMDALPFGANMLSLPVVRMGRMEMAKTLFPRLPQFKKDELLSTVLSSARAEEIPMGQLLVKHGANLEKVLSELERQYPAGNCETMTKRTSLRSIAAKIRP